MNVNVWLATNSQATIEVKDRLEKPDSEYTGNLSAKEHAAFRKMAHRRQTEKMWKKARISADDWQLQSLNFSSAKEANDAVTDILNGRGAKAVVLGAWHWDGRQVGTTWVNRSDHSQGTKGVPRFPLHPMILRFMPDIVTRDKDGNVVSTAPATKPVDVNLIQGQEPRRFA